LGATDHGETGEGGGGESGGGSDDEITPIQRVIVFVAHGGKVVRIDATGKECKAEYL
jgi:hypothetical protein